MPILGALSGVLFSKNTFYLQNPRTQNPKSDFSFGLFALFGVGDFESMKNLQTDSAPDSPELIIFHINDQF